jgi:hypothetical protein
VLSCFCDTNVRWVFAVATPIYSPVDDAKKAKAVMKGFSSKGINVFFT